MGTWFKQFAIRNMPRRHATRTQFAIPHSPLPTPHSPLPTPHSPLPTSPKWV
ncbi:MAG: hypothetical protein KME64_18265 [Scytonematopsis contorta HA4267-MV1]|nr:hypothetical protein [Scytonematopsis contorta HA4267-MV1]